MAMAFTTVSTRGSLRGTGFGSSFSHVQPPPPPPPSHPPQPKKIDWPPTVREYVQRCFDSENGIDGITTEEMQARLKQVINEAAERDALYLVDWPNLALPQEMIQQERAAMMGVHPAPPMRGTFLDMKVHEPASPTNKKTSRKRKSEEISHDPDAATESNLPPWRKGTTRNVFEDRVTHEEPPKLSKRQRKAQEAQQQFSAKDASKSFADLEKRRQRFDLGRNRRLSPGTGSSREDTPLEPAPGPIVGTCQDLEKKYFRLTAPPKPETVRPQPVLEKTFELLKTKWRQEKNYSYICDQFKSMRQDLTVQHIKNEFTVNVYELHARIALEKMDLGEYNQCQSQLRALYKQKLGGNPAEFLAYRILYYIYTCNRTDMNDVFADLTLTSRDEPAVKHALQVRSALALGNYHRFFQLYLEPQHMGGYLMDMFVNRERLSAVVSMCKAYHPSVDLRFITEELAFDADQDTAAFLCDHGGEEFLIKDGGQIKLLTKKAISAFESTKAAAFRRVDIKGQI